MDFKLSYMPHDINEDSILSAGYESFVLNFKDKDKNIISILIDMIDNFISFYNLGDWKNNIINITTSRLNVIRAYYSEYQRIEYELRDIIEDYQDDFGFDRRVYCPGERNPKCLKRKALEIKRTKIVEK